MSQLDQLNNSEQDAQQQYNNKLSDYYTCLLYTSDADGANPVTCTEAVTDGKKALVGRVQTARSVPLPAIQLPVPKHSRPLYQRPVSYTHLDVYKRQLPPSPIMRRPFHTYTLSSTQMLSLIHI